MRNIVQFGRLVLAALREIFDEAAYERFLVREGSAVSRESYAQFLAENKTARLKRPRCC